MCSNCTTLWEPPADVLDAFGPHAERLRGADLIEGEGCDQCFGMGYRGRCAVFELMGVSPGLMELIERRAGANEIKDQAAREGMQSLVESSIDKAIAGETTLEEVRQRVLVWEQTEQQKAQAE